MALATVAPTPPDRVAHRLDGILGAGDPDMLEDLVMDVITRLYASGTTVVGPAEPLTVARQVIAGTRWTSFRAGRQQVASLAGVYVRWFAPEWPWRPTVTGDAAGPVMAWHLDDPAAVVFDLPRAIDHRGAVCDERTLARIPDLHTRGNALGGDYVGVRVLALGAPGRSELHRPDGTVIEGAGPEVLDG